MGVGTFPAIWVFQFCFVFVFEKETAVIRLCVRARVRACAHMCVNGPKRINKGLYSQPWNSPSMRFALGRSAETCIVPTITLQAFHPENSLGARDTQEPRGES